MRLPGIPYDVVPVTDFGQLREGMLVVDANCEFCHGPCLTTLLNQRAASDGGRRFEAYPPCRPLGLGDEFTVPDWAVAKGDIYRVVDRIVAAESAAVRRRLKKTVRK